MKKAILIKLALLTGLCVLVAGCSKGGGSAAGSTSLMRRWLTSFITMHTGCCIRAAKGRKPGRRPQP